LSTDESDSLLFFVRQQRALMQIQSDSIESGDYPTAISAGVKMNAAKREWSRMLAALKAGELEPAVESEVRSTIRDLLRAQTRLLDFLEPARDQMAAKITEVRRGRQLLNGYRTTRRVRKLHFETQA